MTLQDLQDAIRNDPAHGMIHLMNFVDDFRHSRDLRAVAKPFALRDEHWDAGCFDG